MLQDTFNSSLELLQVVQTIIYTPFSQKYQNWYLVLMLWLIGVAVWQC